MNLYVGLMSGTSLDGVDSVLADWASGAPGGCLRERGFVHVDMPAALRAELLALNAEGGVNELHRGALAASALAQLYAQAVEQLLDDAGVHRSEVRALGAHGQTVRHRPREFDGTGYTLQLLNGALLAERTGIDVVCDFRSRDVAAGGQGAPLAPAFHDAVLGGSAESVAVLNVGGIANLTLLPPKSTGAVLGFDCGPGNMLMDLWCQRQRGVPFDEDGRWASAGQVQPALLRLLLEEPYFARQPPKSTGRDLFDTRWLDARLATQPALASEDVMATLCELTAAAACLQLQRHGAGTERLYVCGGGARNGHLMRRLAALSDTEVSSTEVVGIAPERLEALAFAWLARTFCEGRAGNLPSVTGAAGPRVLGALYPAGA